MHLMLRNGQASFSDLDLASPKDLQCACSMAENWPYGITMTQGMTIIGEA